MWVRVGGGMESIPDRLRHGPADPDFPPPSASIFEATKHAWTLLPEGMKHFQGTMIASS